MFGREGKRGSGNRTRRVAKSALVVCVLASVPVVAASHAQSVGATTCNSSGIGYYTPVSTYYSGGIDGSSAQVNVGSATSPYVCDTSHDHTLEAVFLWLPLHDSGGNLDTVENGAYEGYICTLQNTCQIKTGSLYFYQEANLFSQGNSVLNIEWANTGGNGNNTHLYTVQEFTSCSPCHLYAQTWTDVTGWAQISLPNYDNPGHYATYQGEVYNDNLDSMGPAFITSAQVHTSGWASWSGTPSHSASTMYCNNYNSPGGTYSYENYGPSYLC